MAEGITVNVEIPEKLLFLLSPSRYKVLYGGRDGVKSWSIARALLCLGTQQPLRILCARETQQSIRESVHQLLSDQVKLLNLDEFYKVLDFTIRGKNGCEFIFAGLRNLSVAQLKSFEGIDICWVEEAASVRRQSWQTLIPTIRKSKHLPQSEIWVSFNPELSEDDTYKRWVLSPPPNCKVVKTSFRDNVWLSPESRQEIEYLRTTDPATFEHVYEGGTRSTIVGAIYEHEIKQAEKRGQICRVPHDPTKNVDVSFDLGYGDMVSMWFHQAIAFEFRIVDYYENSRQSIDHYLQAMQGRGYTYGTLVLPWDGAAKSLGTGKSIEELIRAKGYTVRVMPQASVHDGINAVRTIFHKCYFDAEKCADGLAGLRRYQWGPATALNVARRTPLHDNASHPSDALRTMAMWINEPTKSAPAPREPRVIGVWRP